MNTSNIKSYAPKARKGFIAAITKQAAKYGISASGIVPIVIKGDLAIIEDRPFPVAVAQARGLLVKKVEQLGFAQTIEQVAYSWFNRLCAIRYMELHDYLGHGRRVLSHPDQPTGYQLLEDCLEVDLPGLNQHRVRELKLDGTKDEELYRELLLAQCHALNQAMPFLFETIDDETELLLPENLTKTDSLIHDLITEIPKEDWQSVEIIGWLYQFYISEKKDQVIGKVVKSEDIPAATQLFTPNWIVKYMVQNSLGAQWLATYPASPLKTQMEYYIEPAEQTDEVNQQLKAITPDSLNPEELTLIDPACGSGHILVEAYDLFKAIYLERGYRQRDVPQLILEKNLFGLDIDERAAQLTGFALMMKGREDDRRLFERVVKLNVMALVDSVGFDAEGLANGLELLDYGLTQGDLTELQQLFEHATTFGSLIQVPEVLSEKLQSLKQLSEATSQDLFVSEALEQLGAFVQQAELLAAQYDAVVANPPYMGSKGMNPLMKSFVNFYYASGKSDLYASFIERTYIFAKRRGLILMVTIQNWMFLSSFEAMRVFMIRHKTILSLVQVGPNSFPTMNAGKVAQAAVFSIANDHLENYISSFTRLIDAPESSDKNKVFLSKNPQNQFKMSNNEFQHISGSPVAYWASETTRNIFSRESSIKNVINPKQGTSTGDDEKFVRYWFEVDHQRFGLGVHSLSQALESDKRYFPLDKGGDFRRWYGNNEKVIKLDQGSYNELRKMGNQLPSRELYFNKGITWSKITSYKISVRFDDYGFVFSSVGLKGFPLDQDLHCSLGFMNSAVVEAYTKILSPTLSIVSGDIERLPYVNVTGTLLKENVNKLINKATVDWNSYERSWDFESIPVLISSDEITFESSYTTWTIQNRDTIAEMKRLEEENNRLFIDAYGLVDELTPDVPIEQITLTVNPAYRYGVKNTEQERDIRFREDTMEELVSYAIGCMMGRYSLNEPGLIYANSGNIDFDASRYITFPADDDGIIPLTDKEWYADDTANRLVEFISVAWPSNPGAGNTLEANLAFLAENLSPKKGEDSRETIRRYLCDKFYKDHMQTYKKRPIYWLFSSGKQKSFQCLVYLHRYNEGTLARMRTEYVIPLTAKLSTHVSKLERDVEASGSTAEIKKLEREISQLHKQQTELTTFDEKLRHYADQRISLDLDDGVKVNYGKFGDLLAEVKTITGRPPE